MSTFTRTQSRKLRRNERSRSSFDQKWRRSPVSKRETQARQGISSWRKPWRVKPLRQIPAWTLVAINQAAFPGLGTIIAGRKVGWIQAFMMVAGFVMSVGFLLFYLTCIVAYVRGSPATDAEFRARYRPHLWALYWGLGCCAASWCWALVSSWQIWRERPRP